jgi:hypothetical protein
LFQGEFLENAKESEEIAGIQPLDMTVSDSEASIANDQNISVAAKLTDDDIYETCFHRPAITREKKSSKKEKMIPMKQLNLQQMQKSDRL